MTRAQIMRLIQIDQLAQELPREILLRREHICISFDVSVPTASADLARFQRLFPDRLEYDRKNKGYRARPGSSPAFDDATRSAFGILWQYVRVAADNLKDMA